MLNRLESILETLKSKETKEQIQKTISEEQKKYEPLHKYFERYGNSKPKNLWGAVIKKENFNAAYKKVFGNS